MKQFRNKWAIPAALLVFGIATLASSVVGAADMKSITVGRTTSASGFHIPSYIAMDNGIFKKHGLDAKYVSMSGKALLNAGIAKQIDYVPIPGGGSQAALKGAPITYLVGPVPHFPGDHYRPQQHQDGAGPQGQDHRPGPARQRRLRRG